MSSQLDWVPLRHRLPFVGTGGIRNQRLHDLVSGEVALGSVMMPGIVLLILQIETNVLISTGLNVGHVRRSEDEKRITLGFGVEGEYRLPDVALRGILNLL